MNTLSTDKERLYALVKQGEDQGVGNLDLDGEEFNGRQVSINGEQYLHFADCSYLGLEKDKRLIQGANEAAEKYGIILSNSRSFLSSPLYSELQAELRKIIPGYLSIMTTTTLGHASALPLLIDAEV